MSPDANLRYLYTGPRNSRGRPKQYDGKVRFNDLNRFEFVRETEEGIRLYTAVVNSVHFKRTSRVVYLLKPDGDKVHTALLFSTAIHLTAWDIYRFYKARFQIEFLFRDAKQFTRLSDCQARNKAALHFHFNATMTASNLIELEDPQQASASEGHVVSIMSWKIRKFNEHLLQRFSDMLGLDFSSIKSHPDYEAFETTALSPRETVRTIVFRQKIPSMKWRCHLSHAGLASGGCRAATASLPGKKVFFFQKLGQSRHHMIEGEHVIVITERDEMRNEQSLIGIFPHDVPSESFACALVFLRDCSKALRSYLY